MPQRLKGYCPSILDFEASGFGSDSYPIEVGVITGDGERYCSLIQPKNDWTHWSAEAARIHQIPFNSLLECGKPVHQVCQELNTLLEGRQVFSDGWIHDNQWLITLYHAAAMVPSFTLSPIEAIASEDQLMVWDKTKQRVQSSLSLARHRASSDALIIQHTFVESRLIVQPTTRVDLSTPANVIRVGSGSQ